MSARPVVSVQASKKVIALPSVFSSPIRDDIVRFVHTNLNKNHRQPYAVSVRAGHQTSAESWGTGRAVSRIPRVGGGGTHRAGQGAFGNMCRKGRMFAPTKVWRRWHRRVNKNQRRYAVCSALAASRVVPLVEARGHRVERIAEIPFVLDIAELTKVKTTKAAQALLEKLNVSDDIDRVKASKHIRSGKGKRRNRRYVQRRGPLVIYNQYGSFVKALRNIPGVDFCRVSKLNLLQLAPGGHLGRFVIWTSDAFSQLDSIFGTCSKVSQQKKGYKPPRSILSSTDISRIINSDEVKSAIRPQKKTVTAPRRYNNLTNARQLHKMNPFALVQRRRAIAVSAQHLARKQDKAAVAKVKARITKMHKKLNKKNVARQGTYKTIFA